MPVLDGPAATRRITEDTAPADVRVVVLTAFEQDEYVFEAIRAGAFGFLVQNTASRTKCCASVRAVVVGNALLFCPG